MDLAIFYTNYTDVEDFLMIAWTNSPMRVLKWYTHVIQGKIKENKIVWNMSWFTSR